MKPAKMNDAGGRRSGLHPLFIRFFDRKGRPSAYFPGQNGHSCGHFYPDVMHIRYVWKSEWHSKILRLNLCRYCGIEGIPSDLRVLDLNELASIKDGGILNSGVPINKFEKERRKELRRLKKINTSVD